VSSLRSAVEELAGEDLGCISDEVLEADLVEIDRVGHALEAERLRRLAVLDRRGCFRRDGLLSTTGWLVARCRMRWGKARERVRMARALEQMPETQAALAAGEVSYSQVRLLVSAHDAHPETFSEHEGTLVEAARTLTVRDLQTAVAYWRQALDWDQSLTEDNEIYDRRRLYVSRTFGGMVRIDGDLDPEGGETVMVALRALGDPVARDPADERNAAQRRADALVEICRRLLDGGDVPLTGGERPHVTVTVDLEVLQGRAGGRCELGSGEVVHPETARRLACDASVGRIITRGGSEPLDVGRRTRVVPAALRRALVVRDGGCRFPGCGRPHRWCDAHHIWHWVDGGPTSLNNLTLLCRRHHRLIHDHGFSIHKESATLRFARPSGSLLEERAPP
jgi:hypothetical protein